MGWPGEQQCQAAHSPARLPHGPHQQCSLQRLATPASLGLPADDRLDAAGRDEANAARLEGLFTAARQAEWAEFLADCGKYEAEQRLKHCAERLEDYADRVYQAVHQP